MKILLINANPVVSRMLALCTRDEDIVLDEVKSVDAVKEGDYDLLFVNDAPYMDQIDVLLEKKCFRKKVLISYDEEVPEGFDLTIKKPFLPSQITEVIENVDMSEEIQECEEETLPLSFAAQEEVLIEDEELPPIFPLPSKDTKERDDLSHIVQKKSPEVLDKNEIEKIKALLEMDDEIVENEPISDDEYEARKVKVIKEQLIANGLEIVEEEAIVEELSTIHQKKKKETPLSQKDLLRIEAGVVAALENMKPKKIEKMLRGKKVKIKIQLEDE